MAKITIRASGQVSCITTERKLDSYFIRAGSFYPITFGTGPARLEKFAPSVYTDSPNPINTSCLSVLAFRVLQRPLDFATLGRLLLYLNLPATALSIASAYTAQATTKQLRHPLS